MTQDGQMALISTSHALLGCGGGDDGHPVVEVTVNRRWRGAGSRPDVDFSCLDSEDGCSADQRQTLGEAATKLGLQPCRSLGSIRNTTMSTP